MTKLESVLVGYISGLVVGLLIVVVFIGWVLVEADKISPPEAYIEVENQIITEYWSVHPTYFEIAFFVGFLSGISGSGTAANSQR